MELDSSEALKIGCVSKLSQINNLYETAYNVFTQVIVCFFFGIALSFEHYRQKAFLRKLGKLLQENGLEDIEGYLPYSSENPSMFQRNN